MKKSNRHVVSIVLVGLVLAVLLGTVFSLNLKPKLGLDLRGGLSVTLTAPEGTQDDVLDKTVGTLLGRVDRAGVAEPEITREGSNNIFIQLPGTEDPARLLRLIGKTAQLQFRQVLEIIPESDPRFASSTVTDSDDLESEVIATDDAGLTKFRLAKAELTGDGVRKGTALPSSQSVNWEVSVNFKREGGKIWESFTGRLACLQGPERQVAIVLDGIVESSPQIAEDVQCNTGISGGTTQITGTFTEKEAKDLALVLTTGALPVELEQSEVRTVSPTLGKDSLRAGLFAGALGLALVLLYVLIYYRTLGLQTWIGLAVFSSTIYGLIVVFGAWIGWNLTLSGIAGLIVSIGIATDSYIVFFERIKEEIHEGRTLRSSIDKGFGHAWRTMRTANTVTILAAVVLYFLAVGPVRGFALALGMATIIDLIITYTLTWPLAALLARSSFFAEGRFIGMRGALEGGRKEGSLLRKIYRSEFNIDFIGRRKLWFLISGAAVLVSALAMVPGIRGLHYGIDFRGGTLYRVPVGPSTTVADVRLGLSSTGIQNPIIQKVTDQVGGRSQIQVQTESSLKPNERDAVVKALSKVTGSSENQIDTESVGEKWGAQITNKALLGLAIFLVLVILYMSWRLEPKMAAAGIVALIHDLVITAGIYALVGFEVTPATVVATLTILGYSLYDTVVVFDKIRENLGLPANARASFTSIANASTNQVLMRSINTSLTVLLPVGSLLFVGSALLGADTLKDLSLALFVGIAAGTYSSICVATPLLSVWKEKEPRFSGGRERSRRAVTDAPGTREPVSVRPEPVSGTPEPEAEREWEPVASGSGPARPANVTYVRQQTRKRSRADRKRKSR